MLSPLLRAILRTVIYADVFDYPLKLDEIWRGLIGCSNVTKLQCYKEIKKIKAIKVKKEFYFLKGRGNTVGLRQEREKWSEEKLKTAQKIGDLLKLIPSIKLVGITGAVAVGNAKADDDIDLFAVTSAGWLWTTRLLTTLLMEITGERRHPGEESVNNKICLNMFAAEDYLEIPKKEQDLFSSHEVVQMKLLWDRGETYKKFLQVNSWVKKYLPNATESINYKVSSIQYENKNRKPNFLENILKQFQLWYMRNRRTTEIIKGGIIRFHPHDARVWVMREYKKRLKLFLAI